MCLCVHDAVLTHNTSKCVQIFSITRSTPPIILILDEQITCQFCAWSTTSQICAWSTFKIMNGSRPWKKKTQQLQKTTRYELSIITRNRGPIRGHKQHVHFKAYFTTPPSVPFLLACVAFIFSLKKDTVSLFLCYALNCDFWSGLSFCA